ncbi:MAG TPA: ROK family protein [Terracidiphilus sp.]|jgi:polyphosphate glucokinase|nr:ROK family protein [Terracidiphilus sp.]
MAPRGVLPGVIAHTTVAAVQFLLMKPKASVALTPAAKALSGKTLGPITLAIDIGGSGLKAMLLNPMGKPVSERQRLPTPAIPTARSVLIRLEKLRALLPHFDRVSIGFPGVVKRGTIWTAFNLHPSWVGFGMQHELEKRWKRPVRVANDAAIQGYGAIKGDGIEMILTLGTGLGSSIYSSGRLVALELGHHPWKKYTYEDYIGRRGLDKYGKKRWNKYLQEAIEQTSNTFNWDHLYLGGGNTKKIDFALAERVTIVPNETGLLGGVALWRDETLSEKHR